MLGLLICFLLLLLGLLVLWLFRIKTRKRSKINEQISSYVEAEKCMSEAGISPKVQYDETIARIADKVSQIPIFGLNENDMIDISFIIAKNPYNNRKTPTFTQNNIDSLSDIRINWNKSISNKSDSYFKQAQKIKSDTQNVHDSAVNADLLHTYNIISKDPQIASLDDITPSKGDAEMVFNRIITQNLSTYSIKVTEPILLTDVLVKVWNRTLHQKNEKNRSSMQNAVMSALADCVENGSSVCSGGIAARLLSSLVLLDFDPSVGHVMTKEGYKSEALSKSNDILHQVIDESLQSSDAELKRFAESFTNVQIDDSTVPEHVKASFYSTVMSRIDKMLIGYGDNITDNVRMEIRAGIML